MKFFLLLEMHHAPLTSVVIVKTRLCCQLMQAIVTLKAAGKVK